MPRYLMAYDVMIKVEEIYKGKQLGMVASTAYKYIHSKTVKDTSKTPLACVVNRFGEIAWLGDPAHMGNYINKIAENKFNWNNYTS
jgi:hypothetical protein